jgi:hypothetical protein
MQQTVRAERTGWRDLDFSRWHRNTLGYDAPMVDIDFLCAEYDRAETVAIIEYKNEHAPPIDLFSASMRAITRLADRAGVPFYVVRYSDVLAIDVLEGVLWLEVTPCNRIAREQVPKARNVSAAQYRHFLYWLRGRKAPA